MSYKVAWLLVGDIITGSSRIMGYNTHNVLCEKGIDSHILVPAAFNKNEPYFNYSPSIPREVWQKWDIVVLQKIRGEGALEVLKYCKGHQIKTVYCLDDWRPESAEVAKQCDAIIVSSDYLKTHLFQNDPRVRVVEHGYESPEGKHKLSYQTKGFTAVYVYGVGAIPKDIVSAIKQAGWKIITIGRKSSNTHIWDLNTVYDNIVSYDVGIVPAALDTNNARSKAYNRAILHMALGMPVIVSPVPEYFKIVKHNVTGLVANTNEEWQKCLCTLKNPDIRAQLGAAAYERVKHFTTERHANLYNNVFQELLAK